MMIIVMIPRVVAPDDSAPDVVVADDDSNDRELFSMAVAHTKARMKVKFVCDGAEALSYLLGEGERSPGPLPRLIVLDAVLPLASGLDVLKRLRRSDRTRLVPVVMLSSCDYERDRVKAFAEGANAYLCKPAGFENLCETVCRLENDWLDWPSAKP
jgi:DNA-binding response OmpR family regulator